MPELFAILPGVPGGLLTWSLGLAFASVFLAVLGASVTLRPKAAFHRLDRSHESGGKVTGAGLRPDVSGRFAKAMPFAGSQITMTVLISLPLFLGAAWLVNAGTQAIDRIEINVAVISNSINVSPLCRFIDALQCNRDVNHNGFRDDEANGVLTEFTGIFGLARISAVIFSFVARSLQ